MQGVVIVAALAIVGAGNFLPQLIKPAEDFLPLLGLEIFGKEVNTPCRYGLEYSTMKRFRNYERKHFYASNRHGFFCWV